MSTRDVNFDSEPGTWGGEISQAEPDRNSGRTSDGERRHRTIPSDPPYADAHPSDIGFFLSLASRYSLLAKEEEQQLARHLWTSRRRIVTAINLARKTRGGSTIHVPWESHYPRHTLSPSARRRLIAAEEYAERLLRVVDGSLYREEGFDRSLSVPPAVEPAPHRGRRSRSAVTPLLTRKQVLSVAPALHESLECIRKSREQFVQHNLRLVVWVAKGFRGRGLDLVDLIQEGNLGLLRAIDRFDPTVGTRFSTFATHWVRQGIRRALAEKARTLRIPMNRLAEARELAEARARLMERAERAPSVSEIAAEMKAEPEKVEQLLPALTPLGSLDAPVGGSELRKVDVLPDDDRPSPLDRAIEEETTRRVQETLAQMPRRQRAVLAMRYGIGYPRECSLEEIGASLGLSRERIRQIEKQAREELRALLEQSGLG